MSKNRSEQSKSLQPEIFPEEKSHEQNRHKPFEPVEHADEVANQLRVRDTKSIEPADIAAACFTDVGSRFLLYDKVCRGERTDDIAADKANEVKQTDVLGNFLRKITEKAQGKQDVPMTFRRFAKPSYRSSEGLYVSPLASRVIKSSVAL